MSLGLDRARTRRRNLNAVAALPTSPPFPYPFGRGREMGDPHPSGLAVDETIDGPRRADARPLALALVLGLVSFPFRLPRKLVYLPLVTDG